MGSTKLVVVAFSKSVFNQQVRLSDDHPDPDHPGAVDDAQRAEVREVGWVCGR